MQAAKLTPNDPAYITEVEYLEGEKLAEERHEYVDGVVYAIAEASRRHGRMYCGRFCTQVSPYRSSG